MRLEPEVLNSIEDVARRQLERSSGRRPVTRAQVLALVRGVLERAESRGNDGAPAFSLSRMFRGLAALKHMPIVADTAEADAAYTKALATGTTPGSYVVPVETATEILELLAQYETFRAAGARIWPLEGVQKITIPVGVSAPTFEWIPTNSQQVASDPDFTPINFDLKNLQSLELVPAQLFKTTRPQFDILLADIYAQALGEAADNAMHASSTVANAPTALMSESGITKINTGGSANGGNLAYSDLLAVLQKGADLKLRGPFAWFMNGRSWLRILSLQSTTSQPIVVPGEALPPAVGYLLGYPVYTSASVGSSETLGSGTNQSHIIFCPPRAVHIGENAEIVIATSEGVAFEANQIAIRIQRYCDWDFQPAASIIALLGVN